MYEVGDQTAPRRRRATEEEVGRAVAHFMRLADAEGPEERQAALRSMDFEYVMASNDVRRVWDELAAKIQYGSRAMRLLNWLGRLSEAPRSAEMTAAYRRGFAQGSEYDPF